MMAAAAPRLLRIGVVPVRRGRWAAVVTGDTVGAPTLPGASSGGGDAHGTGARGSLQQRVRHRAAVVSARASAEWDELATKPPDTWKFRLHAMGTQLLDRIPVQESFLRSIPPSSQFSAPAGQRARDVVQWDVLYPAGNRVEARRELNAAAASESHHKRWFAINLVLLPVTSLAGILPGPNVFFYWNAFRTLAHYQSWRGAEHLGLLLSRVRADSWRVVHDAGASVRRRGASGNGGGGGGSHGGTADPDEGRRQAASGGGSRRARHGAVRGPGTALADAHTVRLQFKRSTELRTVCKSVLQAGVSLTEAGVDQVAALLAPPVTATASGPAGARFADSGAGASTAGGGSSSAGSSVRQLLLRAVKQAENKDAKAANVDTGP